jgi:hypothetical protein
MRRIMGEVRQLGLEQRLDLHVVDILARPAHQHGFHRWGAPADHEHPATGTQPLQET